MNDVQKILLRLREAGWTDAAIADEMDVTRLSVDRWRRGDRYPRLSKLVLAALESLLSREPPPRRRYPDGHYLQRRKRERSETEEL